MTPDRLARVAELLAASDTRPALVRLIELAVEVLPIDGASVAVLGDGEHRGAVAVTSEAIAGVDELQFSLGEGPCIEAARSGAPVLEPVLDRAAWPAFAARAAERGVCSVFSFPLRVGAIELGVLSFYGTTPTDLLGDDLTDALGFAQVTTNLLLDLQDDAGPKGIPHRLEDVMYHRREVHQATGMVAAQLEVDTMSALARIRAHAWAHDLAIYVVALAIVEGTLRFEA